MARIYLAHPVAIYGTPYKAQLVERLQAEGWDVVDPDTPEHAAAYKARGMAHFSEVVAGCDALAFEGMPGGGIGAGVAKEVLEAWVLGKPVYRVVAGGMLWRLERNRDATMLLSEVLTIEETRSRLRIASTMEIHVPAGTPIEPTGPLRPDQVTEAPRGWLSGEDMIAAFYAK